jgi:hypothetical protein
MEVSNLVRQSINATSVICFAAGAVVARNFFLASGCKIVSLFANLVDEQKAAEWDKTGNHYWTQAKKNAVRDLTAATFLISASAISQYAKKTLLVEDKKEEPGFFKTYAAPLTFGIGISGIFLTGVIFKSQIERCLRHRRHYLIQDLVEDYKYDNKKEIGFFSSLQLKAINRCFPVDFSKASLSKGMEQYRYFYNL